MTVLKSGFIGIFLFILTVPGQALEVWSPVGSSIGSLRSIDICESHPDIIIGGTNDSLYRSVNNGRDWTEQAIGSYVVVESSGGNPEILYAGSTHYFIFVSEDLGETWQEIEVPLPHPWYLHHFKSITVNPVNPYEAFVAGASGIYRFYKSGGEWLSEYIYEQGWKVVSQEDLVMFPDDPDTLYSATIQKGIIKLQRQSGLWTIATEEIVPEIDEVVSAMCRDLTTPDMLFVGTQSGKVYRVDRGFSQWEQLPEIPDLLEYGISNLLFTMVGEPTLVVENRTRVSRLENNQWRSLNSPELPSTYYGNLKEQSGSGDIFVSSAQGCLVYLRSLDTWQVRNKGLKEVDFRCVSFSPVNEQDILLGTDSTGVFRSMDGGVTWIESNNGVPNYTITALVRNSLDPQTIYSANMVSAARSVDGGSTWERMGVIYGTADPLDSARAMTGIEYDGRFELFLGTSRTTEDHNASELIYRSEDGGDSWIPVPVPDGIQDVYVIHQDLANPDVIYAGCENSAGGRVLLKSTDWGRSFQEWSPAGLEGGMVQEIIQHPVNTDTFWMPVVWKGVFRSVDGGLNFEKVADYNYYWEGICLKTGSPDLLMAVSSQVQRPWPEVLYSQDGGDTWDWTGQFDPRVTTKMVTADPYRNRVWVMRRNGEIWQTDNTMAAWENLAKYFIALPFQVNDVVVDPSDENTIYVATEGSGVWKSEESGWSWLKRSNDIPAEFQYVRTIDIDHTNHLRLIIGCTNAAESEHRIYETTDGAGHWVRKDLSAAFGANIVDLAIIEQNTGISPIWLATYGNGPFVSLDDGETWNSRPMNPEPPGGFITSVTHTDYTNTNDEPWIFVSSHGGGGTFVWDSGSGTFIEKSNGLPGDPGDHYVDMVGADPQRYGVFWAVTNEGLYRTADFGENWAPSFESPAVPATSVIPRTRGVTFDYGDTYYFSRNDGVWRSQTGLRPTDWTRIDTEFSPEELAHLTCFAAAGTSEKRGLFTGTWGMNGSDFIPSLTYPISTTMKPLGMNLELSQAFYRPGDTLDLTATITNPGPETYQNVPIVILLDVYGAYFWYPSWTGPALDLIVMDVPVGVFTFDVLNFTWPDGIISSGAVDFYGAMIDSEAMDFLGNWDWERFGW